MWLVEDRQDIMSAQPQIMYNSNVKKETTVYDLPYYRTTLLWLNVAKVHLIHPEIMFPTRNIILVIQLPFERRLLSMLNNN